MPTVPLPGPNLFYPGDWLSCNPAYGTNLVLQDCLEAVEQLPRGENQQQYGPGQGQFTLPIQKRHGSCYITIESSGGRSGTYNTVWAVPSALRIVSYTLITECVSKRFGSGGFQTYLFSNIFNWSQNEVFDNGGWYSPPPVSATFFTVSVGGTMRKFNPGNYDPRVPEKLAAEPATEATIDNPIAPDANTRSNFWLQRALRMRSGGAVSWWQYQRDGQEMAYECDENLGIPSGNDCTHIQWNQLGPPSDSVTISPGVVRFFHSDTCYLALSAAISIILNWEQIRAAVSSLVGICIQNPVQTARGGRAHYQSPLQHIGGRSTKHPKRQNIHATGLNALPPGVNLTIFEQREAWTNPLEEVKTCTWKAVLDGGSVSACST